MTSTDRLFAIGSSNEKVSRLFFVSTSASTSTSLDANDARAAATTTRPLTVAASRSNSSARFSRSVSKDAAESETLAPGVMSASNRASTKRTEVDQLFFALSFDSLVDVWFAEFPEVSGNFPETPDAPFWARADDAAPALDPAESPRAPAPPTEPSLAAGRAEKSPVSSSRAFPEKTYPPGSAFNFSGTFPETPRRLRSASCAHASRTRRIAKCASGSQRHRAPSHVTDDSVGTTSAAATESSPENRDTETNATLADRNDATATRASPSR